VPQIGPDCYAALVRLGDGALIAGLNYSDAALLTYA
jgi:hypothetical protein